MKAKCTNSFQGCLTLGKEYDVISKHGTYIYIILDNNRYSWEYVGNFDIEGKEPELKIKFSTNWEVL